MFNTLTYSFLLLEAWCTTFTKEQAFLHPAAGTGFPPGPGSQVSIATRLHLEDRLEGHPEGCLV